MSGKKLVLHFLISVFVVAFIFNRNPDSVLPTLFASSFLTHYIAYILATTFKEKTL